jgi:hypothetical protein
MARDGTNARDLVILSAIMLVAALLAGWSNAERAAPIRIRA